MSNCFGADYDGRLSELLKFNGVIFENVLYFKDGPFGGWSSYYCNETWNVSTLENDADLEVFDLLFKIDIKNGANKSKIVLGLCRNGAYEAVKVR